MTETSVKTPESALKEQEIYLLSGNETAALAFKHVNFHVMGYYPITPSTQIAETLDEMKADGEHDVVMIPGDGEHGAAGICFGATAAGGRVANATSANGLLFSIEQLPVQSGCRYPMILNIVCRTVSGPLSIKGDHSDIMMALNTGWIIFMAKEPQRVYDFNLIATKVSEDMGVRLPCIVAFDGFFTSHQKRRLEAFKDPEEVRDWLGPFEALNSAIDPEHPMTIGPYMNEPDLINNKYQLHLAMEQAREVIPKVFEEYAAMTGREYSIVETYQIEDAEAAIFILNSSVDTACQAVDNLRAQGKKVGLISLTVIRPFPFEEIRRVLKNVKSLVVCDRQDSYGGNGGNMTLEIKAALKDDPDNKTVILSRVYGLSGKEVLISDLENLLGQALAAAGSRTAEEPFDYYGATRGEEGYVPEPPLSVLTKDRTELDIIHVERDPETGEIKVKGAVPRKLTKMPNRIVGGHGACPGCGIFPNLNVFLKGIKGDVVMLFHTGCAMVVTTGFPMTSHRATYIHNLFQNGGATMSGVVEMYHERKRRGEVPENLDLTFIMVTGDGGHDIGLGPSVGAAMRNHKMIILEYDNEGYMNTGNQLSFTVPLGAGSSTSHVGPAQVGKSSHHKDTAQIFAACHIPYVCTATECNPMDMIKKAAKAQEISKTEGLVFVKIFSVCPLNWRTVPRKAKEILQAAVDSCFFPLYEVYHGITTINYDPEAKEKKVPVSEWFKYMGRTRHLTKPQHQALLDQIQAEVDRRWTRLKAMHESPVL